MVSFLQAIDLHKSFSFEGKIQHVLKGIHLTLDAGDSLTILGPSGSGKSTFLNILGTLETPTEGKVLFEGNDIFSLNEKKLCAFRNQTLGFIFQFHHLLPDFTALENVMMPLLIRNESPDIANIKAQQFLQKVGLKDHLSKRPAQLSGGEQQRVAIARALVGAPKLVLADEPTGNLDRQNGMEVFDLLLALNRELGTTLVVVTHNEELARRFEKTVRMIDGRIQT